MALLMEDPNQTDETPRVPLPKTPVLITAATRWEARPLARAQLKGLACAPFPMEAALLNLIDRDGPANAP